MSNIVTPILSKVPAALRDFAKHVLSTMQRKVEIGGDLEGPPGAPRISRAVLVAAAPEAGSVLLNASFAPRQRPDRRVDDTQAIIASQVFGR